MHRGHKCPQVQHNPLQTFMCSEQNSEVRNYNTHSKVNYPESLSMEVGMNYQTGGLCQIIFRTVFDAFQPCLLWWGLTQRQNSVFPALLPPGSGSVWVPTRGGGAGKCWTPIWLKNKLAQTDDSCFVPISSTNVPDFVSLWNLQMVTPSYSLDGGTPGISR